jgi:hypothetical protein
MIQIVLHLKRVAFITFRTRLTSFRLLSGDTHDFILRSHSRRINQSIGSTLHFLFTILITGIGSECFYPLIYSQRLEKVSLEHWSQRTGISSGNGTLEVQKVDIGSEISRAR